jgi:formylglycine-generating enzyme required for sulfatase activity
MALVPGGSLGKSDSDLANEDAQQNGYCSFFYMDETEITNSEYRICRMG